MKKTALLLLSLSLLLTSCGRNLDSFAQCLEDEGAKMYGAYWCAACNEQKRLFGGSKDLIPYQECDQRGEDGDPLLCAQAGIQVYPTWIFADGTRSTGVQSLAELSKKTSCSLPDTEDSSSQSILFE